MAIVVMVISSVIPLAKVSSQSGGKGCPPTMSEAMGPLFAFHVPERSSVGEGHILSGTVKSSKNCSAISNAKLEFWLTNDKGNYDENHRAALFTDKLGSYSFQSNFPVPFDNSPPKIYVRASAKGYQTIVTAFEAKKDQQEAVLDIVLLPLDSTSDQ